MDEKGEWRSRWWRPRWLVALSRWKMEGEILREKVKEGERKLVFGEILERGRDEERYRVDDYAIEKEVEVLG